MVPSLRFNLAETTSAWPPARRRPSTAGPNSANAPAAEAECKENPAQGKWQEARHAGNRGSETQTQKEAHPSQAQIPEDLRVR